jgi:hypothetical protein
MFQRSSGQSRPSGSLSVRKVHGTPWPQRALAALRHTVRRVRLTLLGLRLLCLLLWGLGLDGSLAGVRARPVHGRAGWGWRLRNLPNWWRGAWRLWLASGVSKVTDLPVIHSALEVAVIHADGRRTEYGVVSHRVVTTAFVNSLAAFMVSNAASPAPDAFDHHASGTGTNAEASADTALQTDSGVARAAGTPSNPSANVYRTVATQTYSSSLAITEHGVFSASTSGTLLDRSVFSAVNVVSGDSIQFTYSLTISAGG